MEISAEIASNVNHLFNTNSTPSSEQRNNIQNFILGIDEAISNGDKDISDINEQILALQAKITVIENRRAQLIQQRTNYSSLLSPLRCLPTDIFGKIFVYATRDCARHVLNLSAVCKLWRYAALSSTVLWSTLELGHHTKLWNATRHIDSWTGRAKSYPLSLFIKKQEANHFLDPLDYVYTTDYQWKSVNLDTDSLQGALALLEQLQDSNLETLESLSLTLHFSDDKLSMSNVLRLGHMPKLTTLAFSIERHATFDMLPFPWSQLTNLTISLLDSPGLALDILQACVNLEEFTMNGIENSRQMRTTRLVAMNHLRKLHISSGDNNFLLSLTTPSIQDIIIKGKNRYFINVDFYDYFQSNGSTLLQLSITPFNSRLVQCIPYFQSLVELKLYDTDYENDGSTKTYEVLNSIIVKPQMDPSTIPLPRLKILEIVCQATEQNQKTFMEVVESRWWSDEEENMRQQAGQRSLSRIRYAVLMNVHTELNVFYRKDVDVLRAQGMKIEYLTPFDGMHKDEFYTSRY